MRSFEIWIRRGSSRSSSSLCPEIRSVNKRKLERDNAQVRMFFSSGAAQMKGGGSLCMATYSFVS